MAEAERARIGFVSGGKSSMPHYNSFLPIVPKEVAIDFGNSRLEARDSRLAKPEEQ